MATAETAPSARASGAKLVLLTLAAGQFLMTLDTSVMNVSIATVAEDVGTTVTDYAAFREAAESGRLNASDA